MSISTLSWALNNGLTSNPTQKLVLIVLSDFVGTDGRCLATHAQISELSSISIESVKRTIKQLEAVGLIVKRPSTQRGIPSEYFLRCPALGGQTADLGGHLRGSNNPVGGSPATPPIYNNNHREKIISLLEDRRPSTVSEKTWFEFWDHWRAVRNKSFKHITDRVISRQVNKVTRLVAAGIDPEDAIDLTIENSWQNIPDPDWIPQVSKSEPSQPEWSL